MRCWHFTEMPYPHLPDLDTIDSVRVSIPSKYYDPKVGADLYQRYLDEHVLADELGLDIMLNEHHQTATCTDVAAPLSAAILARQTKRARICILGNPMANRADPVRVAEEMAMIDVISRGRLDFGFVRGVPYETFAANTNPTQLWSACGRASTSASRPGPPTTGRSTSRASSGTSARSTSGRAPTSSPTRRCGSPARRTSRTSWRWRGAASPSRCSCSLTRR